jgi:hypothetical protein
MRNILVFSCPHIPFEHKGFLPFLKRIRKAFNCEEAICLGDLVDNHAISYHEHDPNLGSPANEMEVADKHLKPWFAEFPSIKMCRGNHDVLVDRKSKTVGLPSRAFKPFREIWNLPKGWKDDWEFIINGVKYIHGTGYSGAYGHIKASYDNRMSTVIGHLHSVSGIEYLANNSSLVFGLSTGCGIDKKSMAFAYGKEYNRKPVLSCGVISYTTKGVNAQIIPMELK